MRKRLVYLLVIAMCALSVGIAVFRSSAKSVAASVATAAAPRPQDGAGDSITIDGAQNPDLIPDNVAYSLLFRFLSGRDTNEQKNRVKSYLRMVFGCQACNTPLSGQVEAGGNAVASNQTDGLLAVAEEYRQAVLALDAHALELQSQPSGLAVKDSLVALQRQKEALIAQKIAALPGRIGADGVEKLSKFMREYFKRKVKIRRPGTSVNINGNRA